VEDGATVALVAVAAVALVFIVTRRQEAQTNMVIAQIRADAQKRAASSQDSGALSFQDAFAVVGTAAATYFGGPAAGAKAAQALAPR